MILVVLTRETVNLCVLICGMWVLTRVHPSLFAEISVAEVSDRSYLNMGTELTINNAVLCFEFISDI